MVAGYLQALGMKIVAADPALSESPRCRRVELVPLEDLLAQSDLVTLHVSLTERDAGIFRQR